VTIVLGFDASPASRAALDRALELASQFGDDLVIVNGVNPPGTVGEEFKAHLEALEEIARRVTREATDAAQAAGVEASVVLVRDRPSRALVQVADERDARLIAVGTYGESPLRGAIVGSTPHKLLHISQRPVLVVPAAEPPPE
jgi:nucleotide-binding universal stress UspA family protein